MANEMRLIDANELLLQNELAKNRSPVFRSYAKVLIDNAPTVDAAPVVHGFNTYDHDSAFECSVCGFNDWDTLTADSGKYNYCPNCGAKMDKEDG